MVAGLSVALPRIPRISPLLGGGPLDTWAPLPDASGGHFVARIADGVSRASGDAGGVCTRRGMMD